ncbi:CU044_2847 family protein [Streptomyces sp. NPDC090022]|uniref:CU044_2847 family protein n=1 Tax=Streptomyces sp. NPDC090022 TaxID=3365920 RepID=UPI0037F2FAE9
MERRIQEIELPGGQKVLARVSVLAPQDLPEPERVGYQDVGHQDVGALDQLAARVDQLGELVTGLGTAVLRAAEAAAPDEISATFGIELAVKPGKAVAVLADGEAKAAITVTLTWLPKEGGNSGGNGGGAPPDGGAPTTQGDQRMEPGV